MVVTSLHQARFYLNMARITHDPRYVQPVIDFFMKGDYECPIAEYLSIAHTYLSHGNVQKAEEMIEAVLDFLSDGCGEKDKYNDGEGSVGDGNG